MRRNIIVLCLGLVLACSADQEVDTVYDPCSPLTIAVASDASPAEVHGVEGAIAAWGRVLPVKVVVGTGPKASDVLPIYFQPGETFFRGIYWDVPGEIAISRDRLDPADYALAIAHEMGHAFGLLHVPKADRESVMNIGNLEVAPNAEDAAEVRALWATCQLSDATRSPPAP